MFSIVLGVLVGFIIKDALVVVILSHSATFISLSAMYMRQMAFRGNKIGVNDVFKLHFIGKD